MRLTAGSDSPARYTLWTSLARWALVFMDASLASLWYLALVHPGAAPWTAIILALAVTITGSHALAALTFRQNWPLWLRQFAFLLWLAGLLLLSMKVLLYPRTPVTLLELLSGPLQFITLVNASNTSFLHVIFILVLAWRGVALARGLPSTRSLLINFQMGLIALLLYGLFFASRYPAASTAGLYLYLFSSLVALSATRILSLTDLRGGRVPALNTAWFASTFGSALLVVAAAMLIGWASSGQMAAVLIRILALAFSMLAALVTLLLDPLFRLLWRIIPSITAPFQALLRMVSGVRLPKFLEDILIDLNEVIMQIVPAVIAGRRLLLAAVVLVIVAAVLLGLRWISRLHPAEQAQETGNLEPTSLRALLNRFRLNLAGARRGGRYSAGQILAAARIRQIYSQMMTLSQRLGTARPAAATPLEFLPQLQHLFSEEPDSVQAITQAYVKIRYGELPEDRREVEAVAAAWDRVRKHGQSLARRARKA